MADTRELPDPLVGTVVAGRYRILRRLAAGGMGVVYEATQEPLGRRVAVKLIRGDAVNDPVARLRFEREAKTASSLQEPHVVVVHDYGVVDDVNGGGLFLAMEFVEGETLRQRLNDAGRLPWKQARTVVEHIARALAAAHGKGLVHRDLKPENVMLVPTSGAGSSTGAHGGTYCKVLDFGLAKGVDDPLLQATGGKPLTRSGGFVGTPGYISPEHIDGAAEDPRQDVYALGVVWWEMLTGRHPFPAETPMKTLLRQMHEEPPPLDDVLRLAEGIPPAGAQLVRDMMARTPHNRPRDGAAVLGRLALLDAAPGTETGGPLDSSRAIDSNAPTLPGAPRPLAGQMLVSGIDNIPLIHSPDWSPAPLASTSTPTSAAPPHSGVATIEGRRRPSGSDLANAVGSGVGGGSGSGSGGASNANGNGNAQPTPNTGDVAGGSLATLGGRTRRRPKQRLLMLLVGCSLVGTAGGAVVVKLLEDHVDPPPAEVVTPDPVVDTPVVAPTTEVILEGLSSFTALKAARASLTTPHLLRVYRPERSVLLFDDDVAGQVADELQGKVIDVNGALLVLEVKELDRGRVVVSAVPFVDAGPTDTVDAGAVDGGALEAADGGAVNPAPGEPVPGGLEP